MSDLKEGDTGKINLDTLTGDPILFNSTHNETTLSWFVSLDNVDICINFSVYSVDNPTCLFRYLEKNSTGEYWRTLPTTAFGGSCPPSTGALHCYDIGPAPGGHDNISNKDEAENVTFFLYDVDSADDIEYIEIETLFINVSYTQDNDPPAILISQPWNTTYDNNTISFNVTGDEPLDWVNVELSGYNNTNFTNQSGEWNYLNDTLTDGTYQAIFWFNDTLGNMNTTNIWFTIKYPVPNISFISPTPPNETFQQQAYFEINVSINDSSLDNVTYDWNGTNFTLMNDSLVLMMNLDNISALGENDTHVFDLSGNGNNGTVTDAVVNTTGCPYGNCFTFDGNGDYINIGNGASLNNFGDSMSVSAWIYLVGDGASDWHSIVVKEHWDVAPHEDDSFLLNLQYSTTRPQFGIYNASYNVTYAVAESGISLNKWYHIVGTYNSSRIAIYIDGIINDTGSPLLGPIASSTIDVAIGGTSAPSNFFNGSIDEVRIWNRSLTAEEVYQQYISNLNKYDTDKWLLYVNQSLNATDGLPDGTYTYQAYASNDDYGKQNQTGQRTITIDNAPPTDIWAINPTLSNNSVTNKNHIDVNVSFIEEEPDSCLLELDNGTIANYTMSLTTTGPDTGYCFFNATDQPDGNWNYSVWLNDTAGNWLRNGTWYVTVDAVYISIELVTPVDPTHVIQNTTFAVNSTVTCIGGFCGNISSRLRYNNSAANPDTDVSTTPATPFHIVQSGSNPENCTQNPLDADEWCNVTWTVNATGDIGDVYKLGTLFESNESWVSDNHTTNSSVKIVSCLVDITLQWNRIVFTEQWPGGVAIAEGNDAMLYNTTIEPATTCDVSLFIKSTNFTHNESNYQISKQNVTFNNVSNDYATSYNMTGNWDVLRTPISPNNNQTTYFWLNVPAKPHGAYTGNLTILSVEQGVLP
jgi:hypothetical protein